MTTRTLLWTGGWDSTFRLLQLVLEHKTRVQPVYMIDRNRKSYPIEISTIQEIKQSLAKDHPHTVDLILPTKYFIVDEIPPHEEIENKFDILLSQDYLGVQYKHFANLLKSQHINHLELGIHKDDRAHMFLEDHVAIFVDPHIGVMHKLASKADESPLSIFSGLLFPVFSMTKKDMISHATRRGYRKYMMMTWFCFKPLGDKIACGKCNPCKYTKDEGLNWRIPKYPRMILLRQKAYKLSRLRIAIHERVDHLFSRARWSSSLR